MTDISVEGRRRPCWGARSVAFFLSLIAVTASGSVFAQTGEELSIRRLALERAETAQREGRHPEALELAERAGAIQMTPSVRFFIARELIAVGRRAEGLIAAQTCIREADQSTAANREAIHANCRQIVDSTQPQVASITVRPPRGMPIAGLEVTVAGRPLSALVLGLPYYVDTGRVVVSARAPGRTSFEVGVTMAAGENLNVDLDLPAAAPVVAQPEPPVIAPPEPRPVRPPPRPRAQPSIVGPAVLWGVGGALAVGGGVLLALTEAAIGRCDALSNRMRIAESGTGVCESPGDLAFASGAAGFVGGSVAMLGLGLGAVSAGFGWWAVQGRSGERASVAVVPARGGAAVTVGGAF